jgi:hypothetical protein
MTTQQRLLLVVVFAAAVIGGGALAFAVLGGPSGAGASPSAVAVASPSAGSATEVPASAPASEAPASEPPSEPPSTEPSAPASVEPTASATPKPANPPGVPTTVVVERLVLDAKDDPDGANRRLSFQSQGSGRITVAVKAISPQGSAIACLSADGKKLGCKTTADGKLVANTTTKKANFLLTLRGEGIETPVVEVTITFPAKTPSLKIENARFDGTANPDANGLQVRLTPRADGDATLSADWGGHPFLYEIDLIGMNGSAGRTLANQGPATRVTESFAVTAADQWRLVLQNIEIGFGYTSLDATVSWP